MSLSITMTLCSIGNIEPSLSLENAVSWREKRAVNLLERRAVNLDCLPIFGERRAVNFLFALIWKKLAYF